MCSIMLFSALRRRLCQYSLSDFQSLNLHTTSAKCLDQEWRKAHGLAPNPNKTPALLDGPDYTFLDGRPVPYGSRQRQRIMKQQEYTSKIIEFTKEVDFALERHSKLMKEKQQQIESRLSSKLKKKGDQCIT